MNDRPSRRVVILGAGWLGGALAETLAARGDDVWAMRRTASGPRIPGVRMVEGDVRDLGGARDREVARTGAGSLPPQADAVVLTVAPSRGRGEDHMQTYPSAARGARRLAAELGAGVLLYTSSTAVYGVQDGSAVDEMSEVDRSSESTRALVEAEEIVLADDPGPRVERRVVLRVAGLYGPDRDPARRLRDATVDRWSNFAWRDDVLDAIALLLERAPNHASVFNCADGAPVRALELARALGGAGDEPRASSDANETAAAPSRRTVSNQRVLVARLRALGWSPTVPDAFTGLARLGHDIDRAAQTRAQHTPA